MEEAIRKRVEEKLNSEEIRMEVQRRFEEGRKKLFDEVAAELEKEKEAALIEARQKEVNLLKLELFQFFFLFFLTSLAYFCKICKFWGRHLTDYSPL